MNIMSNKYQYILIVIVFISALFIISIQNNTQSTIILFIERLIGSGDIFYQGYYDDKINSIQGNAFNLLFTDILGSFRITPWSELPKPIGMQLYNMTYNVDLNMGANARHNYLGLICFGFGGSFVFSLILGMIISFIRHKLFFHLKNKYHSLLLSTFYIYILLNLSSIETDFTMLIYKLNSFIITCMILFFLTFIVISLGALAFRFKIILKNKI